MGSLALVKLHLHARIPGGVGFEPTFEEQQVEYLVYGVRIDRDADHHLIIPWSNVIYIKHAKR